MRQGYLSKNVLVATLVLLLFLISAVSAGLVLRPSLPAGKSNFQRMAGAQLKGSLCAEYPKLIDATVETLTAGLSSKKFTSVDLVKVRAGLCRLGLDAAFQAH